MKIKILEQAEQDLIMVFNTPPLAAGFAPVI